MKQIIHDLYSGDEIETLEFGWDQTWKPTPDKDPFKVLSEWVTFHKGTWEGLCDALADLMVVNGQKINGATIGARLNGEWLYLDQIVEGVVANALRQVASK